MNARDEFLRDGFSVVEGALDEDFCESVVASAFARVGMVESDRSTWPVGRSNLPVERNWSLSDVAPRAQVTVDELVGGGDVVAFSGIQDNVIINLPDPSATWWAPDDWRADEAGWHKDGDWFRHFLDSPEQALLVIVFWRDVVERQGPTYVAVDSVAPMARLLAQHAEGLDPADLRRPVVEILEECRDFRALTGRQGTIVFAHPFMLHTASVNALGVPRLISNSSVMLRAPMCFDRTDGQASTIERSILESLGVERLAYEPTGDRRRVESERSRRWKAQRAAATIESGRPTT